MLMRFDPFRELDRLTQQSAAGTARMPVMPMDAYRRGDQFFVHFDLPGVTASSIDLTVEKNVLTVSAERQWSTGTDDQVVVSERPQGTFTRQLFLGEGLDPDGIQASYEDGVLTLIVPVSARAKPRKVDVSGAADKAQAIDTTSTS